MTPPSCVRCDREVEAMDKDYTNSPYGATAFRTHGHYGSTIFDPMNGCFLEINLCDECIAVLGERGQILMGQDYKQVMTYASAVSNWQSDAPTVIGRMPIKREMVPWHKGLEYEGEEDAMFMEPDEILNQKLYPEVQYHDGIVDAVKHYDKKNKE
jgi:hypothetical protein